jgi:hypothetical protein
MNFTVEINVWGKATIDVQAPCEEDAIDMAMELIDYDNIEFERELVDIYPDIEEREWE